MKNIATICVYGDFDKKDIRMKVFAEGDARRFAFQNILLEAGYDAELFFLTDEDTAVIEKSIEDDSGR